MVGLLTLFTAFLLPGEPSLTVGLLIRARYHRGVRSPRVSKGWLQHYRRMSPTIKMIRIPISAGAKEKIIYHVASFLNVNLAILMCHGPL